MRTEGLKARGVGLRVLFLALSLWPLALSPAVAGPAEDFAKANELYERGDFASAGALYQALAAARPDEPAYHYNLGNAFMKTGRLGRAVASYLRAFRLSPRDGGIRHNLAFTLGRAGEELVPPGIPRALFLALHALSAEELAGAFWLAFWAFFLLWGAYLLDSRLARAGPAAAYCLALLSLLGGWRWMRGTLEPERTAVVIRADAEIRNGPGLNFSVGYTVPEGRRLAVLGAKNGWLEIAAPREGFKGWILADSVEKV